MMKKKRLDVEFSYDFELLGIHSSARGYKLAWEINQILNVQLQKKEDLKIHDKSGEFSFSHFEHQSMINTLRLFRNKPNEAESSVLLLVPEHPAVDYILYCQGDEQVEGKRLHELLRNIP